MKASTDPGLLGVPVEVIGFDIEPTPPSPLPGHMRGRGMFFDEYIQIRDPEGSALNNLVLEAHQEVRPKKRKLSATAQANLTERVARLVANALQAHFYRVLPSVLYFRKADAEQYRDRPSWMRHGALGAVVDALEDARLVRTITGKKMPYGHAIPSSASSYAPTEKLIELAVKSGVTPHSIERRLPADALVRLFEPKTEMKFDWLKGHLAQPRRGKRIIFEPTAETTEWTAIIEEINTSYRKQDISLGLAQDQMDLWLTERNSDPSRKGPPYRRPETFKTDLYRVFNDGNAADPQFHLGGRLFGGWWMHVPEELRRAITINGKQTVELDYSHCHPRMLYHERGLDGDGELYALPEIDEYEAASRVKPGTYRPCIKWLVQILLNGRGRPEAVPRPDWLSFPPEIPTTQIVGFIRAKHEAIADAFQTGAGLRLMRVESDIAFEIISTAMAEGWTVLSIHDSFITTTDKRDRLKAMMIDAYARRLKKEPVIKEPVLQKRTRMDS